MIGNLVEKNKGNFRAGKGTIAIIVINVIVFIALNFIPDIVDKLLISPDVNKIIERPWTLITVFFSHEILLHIVLNMALLYIFGIELEKITSSKLLVSLYFAAGLIGSLAIIPVSMLTGTENLIAGASAAVFGIVTAFAVMRPDTIILKSKAKWWALALFFFNAIIVILNPQTSDGAAAHIAGIMVGLFFGYWLKNKESKESKLKYAMS